MSRRKRGQRNDPTKKAPVAAPSARRGTSNRRSLGLTIVTLAVVALPAIRSVVPISPRLHWDQDPRVSVMGDGEALPIMSLGPTGAAWLDVLAVTVAAVALLLHVRAGGRLRWAAIVLAAIGAAPCAMHLREHYDSLHVGSAWLGAVALGLAAAHLAERAEQRRWLAAAIVALSLPIAADAIWYVAVEHPILVEQFEQSEAAFLEARGWERDSPDHLMFRRRMEQSDATGTFAFSNILGSVAGAVTVLAAALAVGCWRRGRKDGDEVRGLKRWRLAWLPATVALFGAVTVVLTRSKGAAATLLLTLALLVLIVLAVRRGSLRRAVAPAGVALIGIAIVTVLLRGWVGPPETAAGERSLLFRFHYFEAAARMFVADGNALTGVGPGGFQHEYAWAKPAINPEDVRSSHSVFVDQLAMLGVAGGAWAALLILWLWQAGRAASSVVTMTEGDGGVDRDVARKSEAREKMSKPRSDADNPLHIAERDMFCALGFAVIVFGVQLVVRHAGLNEPLRLVVWSVSVIGCVAVLALLASPVWSARGWPAAGLFVAATLLLVHGQIEMTFYQPASAPLAWVIVGAGAGAWRGQQRATREANANAASTSTASTLTASPHRRAGALLAAMLFAGAVAMTVHVAMPVTRSQQHLATAAELLRQRPDDPRHVQLAIEELQRAIDDLPADPVPYEWIARLNEFQSFAIDDPNRDALPPAARQRIADAVRDRYAAAFGALRRAAAAGLDDHSLLQLRATLHERAWRRLGLAGHLDAAVELNRELIAAQPHAWRPRVHLAELLRTAGDLTAGRDLYREALRISDQLYLDPLRQMPATLRRDIEQRLEK